MKHWTLHKGKAHGEQKAQEEQTALTFRITYMIWTSPTPLAKKIVTNLHSGQKKTKALSCKFRNIFVPLQARWETYELKNDKNRTGAESLTFCLFLGLFGSFLSLLQKNDYLCRHNHFVNFLIQNKVMEKIVTPPTNTGRFPQVAELAEPLGGTEQVIAALAKLLVNRANRINEPSFLFDIGGTPCMPLEGIVAVSGEAKKGKSQFLTILESVLLSGRTFGNIRRRYDKPLRVLHVDTEQTEFDVQGNLDRLCNLSNWDTMTDLQEKGLIYLRMRKLSVTERKEMLKMAVSQYSPDVIIIDGVRDLVNNFNNEEESGEIISLLMTYADQGKAVFTILHVNEGTNKMRGHLGTELLNKCSDRWNVMKENDMFLTKHITRHREVTALPSFRFQNSNLIPCEAVANIPDRETAEQKFLRCTDEIFTEVNEISYQDFDKELARRASVTVATASKRRKELLNQKIIAYKEQTTLLVYTKPF